MDVKATQIKVIQHRVAHHAYGWRNANDLSSGDNFKYPNGGEDTPEGVGAYRMSRDYNHVPTFNSTRQAIQIMNPAKLIAVSLKDCAILG